MKVKITTDTEYMGKDNPLTESFYLEVEGEIGELPKKIADTYLRLREKLKREIREED